MKYRFEKYSQNNTLLSVVMVILGAVLIIWPGKTLDLAARILGIGLLVGAAISAYSWFRDRHRVGSGYAMLALAIVGAVAGLIVMIAPQGVITLLPKLIGVAVALNGVLNLAQAMDLKKRGGVDATSAVVMAVLTIVAGLFLIFFAFSAMKVAIMVIGGICIYNGVSNLFIESKYRKSGRQ